MISVWLAETVSIASLLLVIGAYVFVSRHDRSYINVVTPIFLTTVPAYYLFPLLYTYWFGTEASTYAYVYVYATSAFESWVFAYFYTRPRTRLITLPFAYGYNNFAGLAFASLFAAGLMYLPILLEFRQDILNPRRIYEQTRIGFGGSFFLSSTLAYLAVVLILFSGKPFRTKAIVVAASAVVLALHGVKSHVMTLLTLLAIYEVYVRGHKLKFGQAIIVCGGMSLVALGLFVATMALGSPLEALESIAEYSDYTRNGMMVIDSNFPRQYGRLTWESNVLAVVPRALMPSKPQDFGAYRLDTEFYPEIMELGQGAPAFGVGIQYADFGFLAIVYVAVFSAITGWLARVCLGRLRQTRHPADFLLLAFLVGITIFPVGTGWMFPETLLAAMLLRFASCIGANKIYREGRRSSNRLQPGRQSAAADGLAGL